MSFISVAAGQPIRATHVQQFTNWLTAQKLDTPGTIACTSTSEYALTVRSQDGTTGLALAVQYGSSGAPTTLAYFTKDESRISSNDGGDYLSVTNTAVSLSGGFSVAGGNAVMGTAALATNATDGFLFVPSCAGAPSGTPTTYTGRVPHVVDTANGRAYWYYGSAWHYATLT